MLPGTIVVARAAAPLRRRLATRCAQSSARRASLHPASSVFVGSRDEPAAGHCFHSLSRAGLRGCAGRSLPSSRYTSIQRRTKIMVPRKAALALTPKAREIFKKMIAATGSEGIMLKYEISSQHALRMAFKFDLIKDAKTELSAQDEGVSLEMMEDGVTPKPPSESMDDGLPKLYIHHAAFMKVLGGTLDVDLDAETGDLTPKLFDREGHEMDPNA
ncbi:hypothetical protein ACHAXT_012356 [Thalassiosira profunda]